jgi:hypothetical protein
MTKGEAEASPSVITVPLVTLPLEEPESEYEAAYPDG